MNALLLRFATAAYLASPLFGADVPLDFNRDVRPILSDKCYRCHGPDAVAKKIPLRLDSEAAAKRNLGGHHAIVDGDPAASYVIRRITAENDAQRMPPVYSGLSLTPREIETMRRWIAEGAKWQSHWSFTPPVRAPLPSVGNVAWSRNPIDRFVLARLEREGLSPSAEASRETLLRRVSLDLTGLPPTPSEVDAFLKDKSPEAYEKVVDRLLAEPRYGERMAARWLDAARYADSNGYQYDGERIMWRWRDWVIDAFNHNKRFDQFALEQIAGDMLPNATLDQKVATGFNRNHRANTEDGIIPEEYAVEYVVDRVETTSTVFLGLTLGCARCHNHKYDPLTQKEFYKVFAYFNNIPELGRAMKYGNSPPLVPAPTAEQQLALNRIDESIHRIETSIAGERSIEKAQSAWEKQIANTSAVYWVPTVDLNAAFNFESSTEAKSSGGDIAFQPGRLGRAAAFDGEVYLDAGQAGAFDIEDRFSFSAWVKPEKPDGAILSKMRDAERGTGYGVYLNKGAVHFHITTSFADNAIRVDTEKTLELNQWHQITVTYTGSRMAEGVQIYVDGAPAKTKVEIDSLSRPFAFAVTVEQRREGFKEPFRIGAGGGPGNRFHGLIDDVRIYNRVLKASEISVISAGESINSLVQKPREQRTGLEDSQIQWYFLENAAPSKPRDLWRQLTALRREKEQLEHSVPTVMVMAENAKRKDTFLLLRGAYDKPGEKVEPGVPAVLPPLPAEAPNNRLGFAKWLIDPGNPLLARVTVNRFWQMYFGTGFVKTAEDFGSQGESPSHPELLDWLATEFIRSGWDVKAMQRLIVTSATYRQASALSPSLLQRDPDNRLLARGPRNRLPAEMIRDQALFAAGLLREKIGGPSVMPYQPAGLWKDLTMQGVDYVQSKGDDLYRRSLYTFWKRTIAPPMMVNFDSALRESCVVRENRTNTPLQALNLMNDVTFVESARFVGQRMMKEGGQEPDTRLSYGFLLITGRKPSPKEGRILHENLQSQLDYFAGKDDEIRAFLSQGDSRVDPALNARELAAYASVASLIFNSDGAVTNE